MRASLLPLSNVRAGRKAAASRRSSTAGARSVAVVLAGSCSLACARAGRLPGNIFTRVLLRWKDTGEEVALFGVNYYPPFHWNYADLKTIGADHEQTIRGDLAHFKRLRLDLLRLHVFDREISDRQGNLLDNEHLRLLDYLIARQSAGHLPGTSPIEWWGVPGPSDGFSDAYPMPRMTTDPAAWAAQGRYLDSSCGTQSL